MSHLTRTTLLGAALLVVLRIAIGWQLLYEGLWKIDTYSTPTPWTSAGYLKNSQGPMRGLFRTMTGDPNDLDWLDVEKISSRWNTWKDDFAAHYGLNDSQLRRLNQMINGSTSFVAELESLPPEVDFSAGRVSVISFDESNKRLVVDGKKHLMPSEKQRLVDQVAGIDTPEMTAYLDALDKVFQRSSRLSYVEQAAAHLNGDAENAGRIAQRIGQVQLYRELLERYENKLASAEVAFQFDHLQRVASDNREKASEVVGPIKAYDRELREEALNLLSLDQIARGPLPSPWTSQKMVDWMTIGGLTALGALLILGLSTRFAAFSAGFMVLGFYMAMPPWPGLPEAPGPEHSFIVNKNLVEVLALFALAALPTGRWFGLDAVVGKMLGRRRAKA